MQSGLSLAEVVARLREQGAELGVREGQGDLFAGVVVFVDGVRAYEASSEIFPARSVVAYAANKVVIGRSIPPPPFVAASEPCGQCEDGAPTAYVEPSSGMRFCASCFASWFEKRTTDILDEQLARIQPRALFLGLSAERDSTVALHVVSQYLAAKGTKIPIRAGFVHTGITPYRDNCRKAAHAIAEHYGIELIDYDAVELIELYNRTADAKQRITTIRTIPEVFERLSEKSKERVAYFCARLHDTVSAVVSESEVGISGFSLSDLFRALSDPAAYRGIFTTRLFPLISTTDEEIGLYAAIRGVDYHVEDCPFRTHCLSYKANRKRQLLEMAMPGACRLLTRQALSYALEECGVTRLRVGARTL